MVSANIPLYIIQLVIKKYAYIHMYTYNLIITRLLVCQFDFREDYRIFHPMRTKVGRIRVNIDLTWGRRLWFTTVGPFSIHIFPAVRINCDKIQQD